MRTLEYGCGSQHEAVALLRPPIATKHKGLHYIRLTAVSREQVNPAATVPSVNDEGARVATGCDADCAHLWYCGRRLGRSAIPGSDGCCGPSNGPQCGSCLRFQRAHGPADGRLANVSPRHQVGSIDAQGVPAYEDSSEDGNLSNSYSSEENSDEFDSDSRSGSNSSSGDDY